MKKDQELLDLVVEEAINLKKHATKEELLKLNYSDMSGDSQFSCIYGQMTGDCLSKRAYELIHKCCQRVYITNDISNRLGASTLNGKPEKLAENLIIDRLDYYSSPIEVFLFKYKEELYTDSIYVKRLVKFLKGEINELKF